MNNARRISNQLRGIVDSNDTFARGGHQVIKIRRPKKKIPEWVHDTQRVREILLRSFPHMHTDSTQRFRAGRWARLINLYFKQQWSRGQIANELGITYGHVNSMITGIKRVAKGLRFDGRGKMRARSYSNR